MNDIIVAGHICVDLVPQLPSDAGIEPGSLYEVGPLTIKLGGCVANTGGDLADLGVSVKLAAAIGDDELSEFVHGMFSKRGFDGSSLQVKPLADTSYSLVLQPRGADRTFWHHDGANALFDESLIEPAGERILHLGYPPLLRGILVDNGAPLHRLLSRVRRAGLTTSLDMAVVDPRSAVGKLDWKSIFDVVLPEVDVFSPSFDDVTSALQIHEEFSIDLVERLAQTFLDQGTAIVSISCGSRGLYTRTAQVPRLLQAGIALKDLSDIWAGKSIWQPAMDVSNIATTNGAGDAAIAGFLFGLLLGFSPEQTSYLATVCAAVKISGDLTTLSAITKIDRRLGSLIGSLNHTNLGSEGRIESHNPLVESASK